MRYTVKDLIKKKSTEKIVAMTCYTVQYSKTLDNYADLLLVGDSLGMVIYGHNNTLSVTMRMMIDHGKAVVKSTKKSLIAIDMPYGSYEKDKFRALESASHILEETNACAVKLEGGADITETVEFLTQKGICVIGHVGLMPQKVKKNEKFKLKGNDKEEEKKILTDAKSLVEAGASLIVLEAIPERLGRKITKNSDIPTIGIGAGRFCDGQILVTEDLLGIFDQFTPKFVKKYANLKSEIDSAVKKYHKEVKNGNFPSLKNIYK